ncbi:alpha/beta hydrolase [Marinilactibacillus kalidii]|uniref:alpha/beta hydrolase n=1 Tax=Marinilactibacillus kalidii TaxID=2820274 RepID=UPI001ABEC565|nr:alpha/beta hydrolase [Marinilactibacillus kalidii]
MEFKDIVTAGYAMAIIEYAPLPDAIFPSQVEDAKMAVRYLAKHAEELEIDVDRLLLCGDSSGGHTALMAWSTWNKPVLDTSEVPLPEIRGCINLYGVYDLLTIYNKESGVDHRKPTSPDSLIIGGRLPEEYPEVAEKASVPYYIKQAEELVPLLIIHGNKDTLVPFEQSVELYEFCKEKEVQATFYCVDGADHGGPTFYTEEVSRIMIDFIEACIQ